MVGLDTGYFLGLIQGEQNIVKHWEGLKAQEIAPYVSVLTFGELLYISIRAGAPEQGRKMVKGIEKVSNIVNVDEPIIEKAAGLKAGRGIPYIDAIIISSFLEKGCREIHTKDRGHFKEVKNKGLKVIFW